MNGRFGGLVFVAVGLINNGADTFTVASAVAPVPSVTRTVSVTPEVDPAV